jgi:hypothetical protein
MELNLRFSNAQQVVVALEGEESEPIAFTSPFTDDDLQELRWYVETYATAYIVDVDDVRARRTEGQMKRWGTQLFEAVFVDILHFDGHGVFDGTGQYRQDGKQGAPEGMKGDGDRRCNGIGRRWRSWDS